MSDPTPPRVPADPAGAATDASASTGTSANPNIPKTGADNSKIPEAVAKPPRRWRFSVVWIVPVIAALFGLWLGVQALLERGPTIAIAFKTAEGIEPRKTKIKYKNVDMGEVRAVTLSDDRTHVIITAQLTRDAARFLGDDTRFWVVRPRVSAGSVTGLGTLLSGSHIGMDAGTAATGKREFTGLEQPAIVTSDLAGKSVILRTPDIGSLDVGSPIYFRHIQAGQVVAYDLDADGKAVTLKAFIDAPYDKLVTANSRFWQSSGIDLSVDANGVKLNTESLVTILLGGLAFEAPEDAGPAPPAPANTRFDVFADRALAMRKPDPVVEEYVMVFKESVRGLAPGAPVDFRGVVIGEVTGIEIGFDPARREFTVPVHVRLYPERLRHRARDGTLRPERDKVPDLIGWLVGRGLRAQLRSANLLTKQLYIAVDMFPKSRPVHLTTDAQDGGAPARDFPTETSSLGDLEETVAAIAAKLNKVPFEAIGNDLHQTLQSADSLIKQLDRQVAPEARKTLADAQRALGALEQAVGSTGPLQGDARQALREIQRAAESFRALSDYLERHPEALIRGKKEDGK